MANDIDDFGLPKVGSEESPPPPAFGVSYLVALGASAGGLEALERFFKAMPTDSGMAFVVIQHLSPDFKSLMKELLERFTEMKAVPVTGTEKIEPNTIYLLPPNRDMVVEGGSLVSKLRDADKAHGTMAINAFFVSLAAEWADRGIAIVLSGTGTDGSSGLLDVRDAGGLVLAQTESSAGFDGMPRSAANTGCVDAVLDPEDMPAALQSFTREPGLDRGTLGYLEHVHEGVPTILKQLRDRYGIDFTHYKPNTIQRRIERRVALLNDFVSAQEYSKHLTQDSAELNELYRDLLIGVTKFFRDSEAFKALETKIVPKIVEMTPESEPIRIWNCGCSTGEEAYSIAILMMEAFAAAGRTPHLRVLATDLHRESVEFASEGIYEEEKLIEIPRSLRDRYFHKLPDGRFRVTSDLRKSLVFSEHNLLTDPPFTRLDLVSCRNLLIYLKPAAQVKAIASFHFGLKLNGYMFLGASESPGELSDEFEPANREWKIYRKTRENGSLRQLRTPSRLGLSRPARSGSQSDPTVSRAYDWLLDRFVPAALLVDENRELIHIFGDAHRFVGYSSGRITGDLLTLLSDDISMVVGTAIRNASRQNAPVRFNGVRTDATDESTMSLSITVEPFRDRVTQTPCFLVLLDEQEKKHEVSVADNTDFSMDEHAAERIRELEVDLLQARESLQTAVEELETSNEELQASNEELLASNEELQSTNEELHSVNEELYSVNAEHEIKIEELNAVSSNLDNLVRSTPVATIFLDLEYRVRLFTPGSEKFFNLLPKDVGRDLRDFRANHDDETLFEDIEKVRHELQPSEKKMASWEGGTHLRRISPFKDTNNHFDGFVLAFIELGDLQAGESPRAIAH